jgi:hypothetical protein
MANYRPFLTFERLGQVLVGPATQIQARERPPSLDLDGHSLARSRLEHPG